MLAARRIGFAFVAAHFVPLVHIMRAQRRGAYRRGKRSYTPNDSECRHRNVLSFCWTVSPGLLKLATNTKEGKVVSGSISFSYTGEIVTFTAPTTGTYDIEAIGGSGGNGFLSVGGDGAIVGGDFMLTAGETLSI